MPLNPSHTQTLSFLKRQFEERGIDPRKKLGQHFLIDLNLRDLVLRSARLGPDDVVLEVGTGTGSLTAPMANAAAAVVTVEVDPQLFALAAEELVGRPNVDLLQADVLKNKNHINPIVLDAVERRLREAPARRFKLVANLPYNIATPVVSNLLALDVPPRSMTVTIQKELADRIVARPGTKDYGSLSIWIQSQCRAEIVRLMPPSVFWPRPKVDSAIVQIELDDALRGRIADRRFSQEFIRALFFHRRKFLRSELASLAKPRLGKPEVDQILADRRLDGTVRAETLDVDTVLALAEAFRAASAASGP
jgi:16S rRNA (adenine1518-N6/adenine1519-N6)-dimethyltransferase